MSLSVQPVTIKNWRELAHLRVREDQTNFVASNVYSIAESQFGYDHPEQGHWNMVPYGIYDGDVPVGFFMIGYNFSHSGPQGFIIRLMVDEQHQNKGYGTFAMNWILGHFRADERIKRIGISYDPGNDVARKLYASLGFIETGEIDHGEVIAELQTD
jgi:diamine N-acetyltransferase